LENKHESYATITYNAKRQTEQLGKSKTNNFVISLHPLLFPTTGISLLSQLNEADTSYGLLKPEEFEINHYEKPVWSDHSEDNTL